MITLVNKKGQVSELPGVSAMPDRVSRIAIIDSATKPELQRLANRYHLDYGNLCDVLDVNEAPRLERRNDYDYLFLRLPNSRNRRDASQITRPILLVYNAQTLFIVTGLRMDLVVERTHMIGELLATTSIASALICTIDNIIELFDYHIKAQTDIIHDFVGKIQNHKLVNEDFLSFILLEDQINNFTSALTPMVPLMNRLQADHDLYLTTDESDAMTDIILASQQSINLCDANVKRIASIRDAYTTLSSNTLNHVMKLLTIATLLIAAPNLVFSMYGMNIRLPMQHDSLSFVMVCTLAVSITILVIIWGRRHRLF